MIQIHGIITAMVTPMNQDEALNIQELNRQVERQIDSGVQGLFCLGTNGEAYILSEKEKLEIIEAVVRQSAGRLPVYAGTGCIGTGETVALSRKAQQLGADALSVITPYFAVSSQEEMYAHFMTVADSVDIPVLLYNIPARTGVSLAPNTVKKLAQHPNIAGIKDSSGNFDLMQQYIEESPEHFVVLSGNDSLVLPGLMAGGRGAICGMANLFPGLMASIYAHWCAGRMEKAAAAQKSIRKIRDCLRLGNPSSIVKLAMNLLGHPVGPSRKPFNVPDSKVRLEVEEVLNQFYKDVR